MSLEEKQKAFYDLISKASELLEQASKMSKEDEELKDRYYGQLSEVETELGDLCCLLEEDLDIEV